MTSNVNRIAAIIEQTNIVERLTPAKQRELEQELSALNGRQLDERLATARAKAEDVGRTAAGLPKRNTKRS